MHTIRQLFLPERLERGNTNQQPVQPIDSASWIWAPGLPPAAAPDGTFLRFRRTFDAIPGGRLRLHVSADERFVLLLDGEDFSRGPHRGTVEHWLYQSYDIDLAPSVHTLEAVVYQLGDHAPLAQLTSRGGFILKAEGAYDETLTTGKAEWTVAPLACTRMTDKGESHTFGVGDQCEAVGTSYLDERPADSAYRPAVVVRGPIQPNIYGLRANGWMLYPTTLPDQLHERKTPGVLRQALWNGVPVPLPDLAAPIAIPADTRAEFLWDLGDYYGAYPELTVSQGAGASIRWGWAESLYNADGTKGHRDDFEGKTFRGFVDTFRPDGRPRARFTAPWWRSGRWCRLEIQTAGEPLTLERLVIAESRYPTPPVAEFHCDDGSLEAVQRLCVRGMQMCMHEMFFDCPYYEQQMYPGDTRVQLLTVGALHADDRLNRHAITLYDLSRRDNGFVGMNFPTRGTQESATYTMIWPYMFRDYALWHDDIAWLRARLPGLRNVLDGLAAYEDDRGLVENLSGWSFMDWVPAWPHGIAPHGDVGQGVSALNNLQYLHALQSAADTESAMGEAPMAARWRDKANRLAAAIVDAFWSEERGLVADTEDKDCFSEHAQCFALLCDILPDRLRERAWHGLLHDTDLARCTVYFSHYLFETYFRFGRADLFLRRLDLWRDYVAIGLRTPLEAPGNARSDCHAWGSHPLYHLHAGVAGIRPAEPFFRSVRIAPCPGPLRWIHAKTPSPHGLIETRLAFDGNAVHGTVTLPACLSGTFEWHGQSLPLHPGSQTLSL